MARITCTLLAALFFITACGGMTIDERFEAATACGDGPECQELWDDWNAAEDRRMERERFDEFQRCPEGYWFYGNNETAQSCYRRHKQGRRHSCRCISNAEVNRMLEQW